jgi:hypothetical protein
MTVTLTFKPEIEAGLLAQAETAGMTVEEFLLSLVEDVVRPEPAAALSPEERGAAFEAWSASHRATPPLSDHAISRESMYEGRND